MMVKKLILRRPDCWEREQHRVKGRNKVEQQKNKQCSKKVDSNKNLGAEYLPILQGGNFTRYGLHSASGIRLEDAYFAIGVVTCFAFYFSSCGTAFANRSGCSVLQRGVGPRQVGQV